ncbi:MAG TPA: hypothetical protein VL970_08390 [Candidatus Acidoferrales bacterium]|nr:hypothetical protein [Candidatus Acidoferrales bacterium]
MIKLCDINAAAREKLPPAFAEKSGIGSHYVDAFVKPMNTKLPDGTRVACRRKGLKITLTVGAKKGEGLMRRLAVSKDPVVMLAAALQEAAKSAGVDLVVTETEVFVAV